MTVEAFEAILGRLLGPTVDGALLPTFDPQPWLADSAAGPPDGAPAATVSLTAAFLVALCGPAHPTSARAVAWLADPPAAAPAGLAALYRRGLALVRAEIESASSADPDLAARLRAAADGLAGGETSESEATELIWSVFCPEAVGIRGHEQERESALRSHRSVVITRPNPRPIDDPAGQVLLTSNVLLTVPASSTSIDALPYPADLRRDLALAMSTAQAHWYDHPIQIGVERAGNELLYGLRELDEAVGFEQRRRPSTGRATCLLSVSVTHPSLHGVARRYVEAELDASEPLRHLDVHVFTEDDTDRLVDEVLAPAARALLEAPTGPAAPRPDASLRDVFGVDGAYGRHYSFLKAITAVWHVLIDPDVRGTFKIDLDQVFPQETLVAETGRSAFEHLESPLWGALGVNAGGRAVELGMIAGALVNERDIGRGLFTPDVTYPRAPLAPDQVVFLSALPQALSTRAEMMERYDGPERDGARACLERVHVTGGTNGILVDALRRHRPFTPSFVGRAEDQAYLLSVLGRRADDAGTASAPAPPRLAYLHAAGLIMRHDKEAFAGEAIAAAEAGKLIGDDVRVLQFSAYARAVAASRNGSTAGGVGEPAPDVARAAPSDVAALKAILDPFTGCFISHLPVTVALLRFALRIVRAFGDGRAGLAVELAEVGAPRLDEALTFTAGDGLRATVARERAAWDRYYDVLDALESALAAGDPVALDMQARARGIVARTRVEITAVEPRSSRRADR